jgi:hypothetical protein
LHFKKNRSIFFRLEAYLVICTIGVIFINPKEKAYTMTITQLSYEQGEFEGVQELSIEEMNQVAGGPIIIGLVTGVVVTSAASGTVGLGAALTVASGLIAFASLFCSKKRRRKGKC